MRSFLVGAAAPVISIAGSCTSHDAQKWHEHVAGTLGGSNAAAQKKVEDSAAASACLATAVNLRPGSDDSTTQSQPIPETVNLADISATPCREDLPKVGNFLQYGSLLPIQLPPTLPLIVPNDNKQKERAAMDTSVQGVSGERRAAVSLAESLAAAVRRGLAARARDAAGVGAARCITGAMTTFTAFGSTAAATAPAASSHCGDGLDVGCSIIAQHNTNATPSESANVPANVDVGPDGIPGERGDCMAVADEDNHKACWMGCIPPTLDGLQALAAAADLYRSRNGSAADGRRF